MYKRERLAEAGFWMDALGQVHDVQEMSDTHLNSAIGHCETHGGTSRVIVEMLHTEQRRRRDNKRSQVGCGVCYEGLCNA